MTEETKTEPEAIQRAGGGVESERFLAFSLCSEEYAVPLPTVKEVIALTEITPVPYTPPYFKGIMNLRGQVISVIDLRTKFKFANAEVTPETSIIILDLAPLSLGVIVDSVNSVMAAAREDIQPPPDIESTTRSDYITGVLKRDKKLVILLAIAKVLNTDDMKALRSHAEAVGQKVA